MENTSVKSNRKTEPTWRNFSVLLFLFLAGTTVASILPTPNSWSDVRSQWLPPAIIACIALCAFIATFAVYKRLGTIFKIQATILWIIFGAVVVITAYSLWESINFLREVRGNAG